MKWEINDDVPLHSGHGIIVELSKDGSFIEHLYIGGFDLIPYLVTEASVRFLPGEMPVLTVSFEAENIRIARQ